MATIVLNDAPGVPLRLYFDIEAGQVADADVAARASLAFTSGVREISYILDPTFQLHLGIQGFSNGSLWHDFLAQSKGAIIEHRAQLIGLSLSAIIWIMLPPAERIRDNLWGPILDRYLPEYTPAERAVERTKIQRVVAGDIAPQQRQAFYREAERDSAIMAVGANLERQRPALLVPRSEFSAQSGKGQTTVEAGERTSTRQITVTLISPVLEVGSRRWKFAAPSGEFGAPMKDTAFLQDLFAGNNGVAMRPGIEMDIELETKERQANGVWQIAERAVTKVYAYRVPQPLQGLLFPNDGGEKS